MERLYTLKEIVDQGIIPVSISTLRRYIKEGSLTAIRVGQRKLVISQSAIDEFYKNSNR